MGFKIPAAAAVGCLIAVIAANVATAETMSVVTTAGPLPEIMRVLVPPFEHLSGHEVSVKSEGAPAILKQIKDGANIDLVVAGSEVIDELLKAGRIAADGSAKLMLSRVGVAVREGAPKPDISTPEAFKAALVAAKSVAYSRGASGRHFATVIERLGLVDVLKPKAVIVQGRPVAAAVAAGEAEIGIQQVAELLPVKGITLVGPLPDDLQKIIPYSAGVPVTAKEANGARALLHFFAYPGTLTILKQKGMQPTS
jgi:molybdate transport system substrate-binding protein